MNLKRANAIGGSANTMLRHALCVFPVLPSLMRNENPFSRASSVREKIIPSPLTVANRAKSQGTSPRALGCQWPHPMGWGLAITPRILSSSSR